MRDNPFNSDPERPPTQTRGWSKCTEMTGLYLPPDIQGRDVVKPFPHTPTTLSRIFING